MVRLRCQCGQVLKVSDADAGKKGRCPACGNILLIPILATEPVEAPEPARPASKPALGPGFQVGHACPSCQGQLPEGAKICVECGIRVGSGRPVLTARVIDQEELEARAEKIIRPISWLVPLGIYPVYSEAMGRSKPYTTWAIAAVTVLTSIWFLAYQWSGSPKMRSMKNLMQWNGEAKPSPEWIRAFYKETEYGDRKAFSAKREELRGQVPDEELDLAAHEALSPQQQCLGQYRFHQLITSAFLHAGPFHLAGNLLFLLIFGSRVNSSLGNIGTLILYPVLAVIAGLAQKAAAASGMPMPGLGASGAVMGMAGLYLILFPLHRVHMALWFRWGLLAGFRLSRKFFAVPGLVVVLFYIAFDVLYTILGLETGVAHWAHLGGFIAGAVAAVALLAGRVVYSGGDILSLVLGKLAWPLIGTPSSHAHRKSVLGGIISAARGHSPR